MWEVRWIGLIQSVMDDLIITRPCPKVNLVYFIKQYIAIVIDPVPSIHFA